MTPLPEPEVTIPFGAIIDKVKIDRDSASFEYLMEPYGCPREILQVALTIPWDAAASGETAPAPAHGVAPAAEPEPAALQFQSLSSTVRLSRAKVPGGWLLATPQGNIAFYPDPAHEWNGESAD